VDPTQPTKHWKISTQSDLTHGSIQPMDNCGFAYVNSSVVVKTFVKWLGTNTELDLVYTWTCVLSSFETFFLEVITLANCYSVCFVCVFTLAFSEYEALLLLCIFYPRDAMLARVLAMAMCPSVCPWSQSFYRNGWTNWAGVWHPSYTVLSWVWLSPKIRVLPSGTLSQTPDLENIVSV